MQAEIGVAAPSVRGGAASRGEADRTPPGAAIDRVAGRRSARPAGRAETDLTGLLDRVRLIGFEASEFDSLRRAIADIPNGYRQMPTMVPVGGALLPLTPPIAPKATPNWEQTYASAVYDRHGFVVPISGRRPESLAFAPVAIDPAQFVPSRVIRRPAVYGGLIYPQFGHNLLELPGRLWACPDPGDRRPVVFHQVQSPANRMDEVWPYLGPLLLAAGIGRRRIVVVRRPILCEDLLVPQPTVAISQSIRAGFHDVYRRIARRMLLPPVGAHRRIYLSRSRFRPTRPTPVNERALEARLAEALGFKVIYPEGLSVERQIAHIRNAEIVVGLDGSALHMALFARPGTMVISLATRLLVNQAVIEYAAELRGRHIDIGGVPDEPSNWRLDVEALVDRIAGLIAAG